MGVAVDVYATHWATILSHVSPAAWDPKRGWCPVNTWQELSGHRAVSWKTLPFQRLFSALGREQGIRQLLCKSSLLWQSETLLQKVCSL